MSYLERNKHFIIHYTYTDTYKEKNYKKKKRESNNNKKNYKYCQKLNCPSLFETYLNKANYIISEKLSRVFSVAGFL